MELAGITAGDEGAGVTSGADAGITSGADAGWMVELAVGAWFWIWPSPI
jgi:hypothetical protein